MTTKLFGLLEKFVVPIVAGTAGFGAGAPIVLSIAQVLEAFVPGVSTLERWTTDRHKGGGQVSLDFTFVLAGVSLLAVSAFADSLMVSFLGKGRYAMMVRKASASFLFGVAMRAFVESWAPLRDGLKAIEAPVTPTTSDTGPPTQLREPFGTPKPVPVPVTPPKAPPRPPATIISPVLPPPDISKPIKPAPPPITKPPFTGGGITPTPPMTTPEPPMKRIPGKGGFIRG